MAKKKENNTDKEKRTAPKKSISAERRASKDPQKSGEVKGPMGVGAERDTSKKSQDLPKKEDSAASKIKGKNTATSEGSKNFPEQTEALPLHKGENEVKGSKTSEAGNNTTSRGKKGSAKPSKFHDPITDDQLPSKAAPAVNEAGETGRVGHKQKPNPEKAGTSETTSKKADQSQEDLKKDREKQPKKMSRQQTDPSISAEEKMKLPNTSPQEDLSSLLENSFKDLAEKYIPGEKSTQELEEMARKFFPDAKDVQAAVLKFSEMLTNAPDKAREMINQYAPDQKDISAATKKAKTAAEKAKTAAKKAKPVKEQEQKSSKDKPVEATLISDFDVHLFKEGKHFHLYQKFGSHLMEYMGTNGVYFSVWAPNAEKVAVIGDFNNWNRESHVMKARWDHSGIWEIFIPEAKKGSLYKYFIRSSNGYEAEKGDPFAFSWETPPNTASMVWDLENTWKDNEWMKNRKEKETKPQPYSVYELHLGSWKRVPEDNLRSLTYRELAEDLPKYLKEMGFTHVEFMPVMEHPFFGSWGYQITGYFAPSSRFGSPQDFMFLIDSLHQAGIGVILDWVPSHFPSDLHGLHYFDGTFLYEHADPKKGFHPDWQSYIFNYGRNEVRAFLISNALFWLDMFHVDGLRVDAVASMLYLDYSRNEGEWEPNEYGGRENLEAISFLKEFNEVVYKEFPDVVTIAEESTAWPMVSRPTYLGGLGFGMKWMMGWMHDTLEYFSKDPVYRKHHQNTITFSSNYAFSENFMLPLSHDEVVYGKGSILSKMPGDEWNKFANIRTLYSYMFAHPGSKLIFMGGEFGQGTEWNHDSSLDWHLIDSDRHRQVQETLKELNKLYRNEPALYEKAFSSEGFEWIDINDEENSIISFIRKGNDPKDNLLIICNFIPVPRENYRIGVKEESEWKEIFNSDEERFGGSNVKNMDTITSQPLPAHRKDFSLALTIPPLGVIFLKRA